MQLARFPRSTSVISRLALRQHVCDSSASFLDSSGSSSISFWQLPKNFGANFVGILQVTELLVGSQIGKLPLEQSPTSSLTSGLHGSAGFPGMSPPPLGGPPPGGGGNGSIGSGKSLPPSVQSNRQGFLQKTWHLCPQWDLHVGFGLPDFTVIAGLSVGI